MKKYILTILAFFALSCERQPLDDECPCEDRALIPIDIDWVQSGVAPKNVTILIYNQSDSTLAYEHTYEHNTNDIQSYVGLPVGSYTAMVFNELRDQIDYLDVENHQKLSTLRFSVRPTEPIAVRESSQNYQNAPGDLALKIIDSLEVTENMLTNTHTTRTTSQVLMGVVPDRKTMPMNIIVHVKGLDNARMPALIDLKGIADGYYPLSEVNSTTTASHQFTIGNRKYDQGSESKGTISTQITLLGVVGDRYSTKDQPDEEPLTLDMLFELADAERTIVNHTIDITKDTQFIVDPNGAIALKAEVWLSEPLPQVTPEIGAGDSGFGSMLKDWDVIEVIL